MEVPFPTAHIELLNGLKISLRPDWTPEDNMGVNYVLEAVDSEGRIAQMKLKFSTWGHSDEQKSYIDITASRGLPFEVKGPNYSFKFTGAHPAFHPTHEDYSVTMTPKGYSLNLQGGLNTLRLYHEHLLKSTR